MGIEELAPSGKIRFAINLGNPVLAQGNAIDPAGVTVDLSRRLALSCGVEAELLTFTSAGAVVAALKAGACDIAYIAVDAARSEDFAFSPAYVLMEGTLAVRADRDFQTPSDVDRPGVRIASTTGTAYTRYLADNLKSAQLVDGADGFAIFRDGKLDAVASIRQVIAKFVAENPDTRMIADRFMEVPQAMAILRSRGKAAALLHAFIEEAKASGFVAESLRASGNADAVIAPPHTGTA